MKFKQKPCVADTIADLLTVPPSYSDPEDEPDPETTAKISEDTGNYDEDDIDEELLSKIRKQNIDLLADVDERYAGKKASRKSVQDFEETDDEEDYEEALNTDSEAENNSGEVDSDESEVNEDSQHSDNQGEEEETDEELGQAEEETDEDLGQDEEETDEDLGQDEDETDDEDQNSEGDHHNADDGFQHMSNTDASSQVKKGLSVKNQLNVWEKLLELRIHLQKCVIAANKMPPYVKYQELKKEIGKEFTEKVAETKASMGNLLDKLMLLQSLVQKKYPETKTLGKGDKRDDDIKEDEEIPSDTDNEEEEESENEEDNIPVKKRKLASDYEKEISENFKLYKPYRNSVIQKWHEKTRLTGMKSNAVSPSILEHISHVLNDKSKLLKRTQLRRSDYKIVGEESKDEQKAQNEDTNSRISQLYNSEIFDDDDFYHQLLRELIEVKSADITDPVQLGRQWIQLQNLRSKMKRKIDTKATKGRKIRYSVHTKLVNFMAPIDNSYWPDDWKNELYSSLFGKKQL